MRTDWGGTGWFLYIVKSAVSVMFIYSGYYLCKNKTLQEQDKAEKYLVHLGTSTVVRVLLYFLRDVGCAEKTWGTINETFSGYYV